MFTVAVPGRSRRGYVQGEREVRGRWQPQPAAGDGFSLCLSVPQSAPRSQTITFPDNPPAHAYGDADFDPEASATSEIPVSYKSTTPGVCTVVGGKVHIVSAGECGVTASQGGNDDWAAAPDKSTTFEIRRAALSVKADDKTKVYGDANPGLTGELTGVKNNDAVTANYSTAADNASGAGTYVIAAHVNGEAEVLANYDVTRVDGTLSVSKAPLSVKANDASRKYGDADAAFSGVITGVKNNDVVSATYSSPATPASNVGTYPIVPQVVGTTAVLANYETPVLTNGTLTVGKAPLSVKADNETKIYGDENPERRRACRCQKQ